jgi:CRP-like cAMP-binding protein
MSLLAGLTANGTLAHLDAEALAALSQYGSTYSYKEGDVIIREKSLQNHLGLVVEGQLEVIKDIKGRQMQLALLRPGDCFGEMSLFQSEPASATVRAQCDGKLWLLSEAQMQKFIKEHPAAGLALIWGVNTVLSQRIDDANGVIRANQVLPSFLSVRSKKSAVTAISQAAKEKK